LAALDLHPFSNDLDFGTLFGERSAPAASAAVTGLIDVLSDIPIRNLLDAWLHAAGNVLLVLIELYKLAFSILAGERCNNSHRADFIFDCCATFASYCFIGRPVLDNRCRRRASTQRCRRQPFIVETISLQQTSLFDAECVFNRKMPEVAQA
jgi:hypothetical protein